MFFLRGRGRSTSCAKSTKISGRALSFKLSVQVLETPQRYLIIMEKVEGTADLQFIRSLPGKDLFEQMEDGQLSHIDAREVVVAFNPVVFVVSSLRCDKPWKP